MGEQKIGGKIQKRIEDACERVEDFAEELGECLTKPRKTWKKLRKKTSKKGKPAYSHAERMRGLTALIFGATVVIAAALASTEGITGVRELAQFLVGSWVGRALLVAVGSAYLIYGLWKLIMGAD